MRKGRNRKIGGGGTGTHFSPRPRKAETGYKYEAFTATPCLRISNARINKQARQ